MCNIIINDGCKMTEIHCPLGNLIQFHYHSISISIIVFIQRRKDSLYTTSYSQSAHAPGAVVVELANTISLMKTLHSQHIISFLGALHN